MTEELKPSQRAREGVVAMFSAEGLNGLASNAQGEGPHSSIVRMALQAFARFEREVSTNKDETIAKLREALCFYARENNWKSATLYMCGHNGASSCEIDRGEKARTALTSTKREG